MIFILILSIYGLFLAIMSRVILSRSASTGPNAANLLATTSGGRPRGGRLPGIGPSGNARLAASMRASTGASAASLRAIIGGAAPSGYGGGTKPCLRCGPSTNAGYITAA